MGKRQRSSGDLLDFMKIFSRILDLSENDTRVIPNLHEQ